VVCMRSATTRGPAKRCESICTNTIAGAAECITRESAHERAKAIQLMESGGRIARIKAFGSRREPSKKRSEWAKYVVRGGCLTCECSFNATRAPSLITGGKNVNISEDDEALPENEDASGDEVEEDNGVSEPDGSSSDASQPASPRVREDEDDNVPSTSFGIGSGAPAFATAGTGLGATVPEAGKPDIGSKGGIGCESSLPSAFGSSCPQRAFVRQESAQPSRAATPLSMAEQAHFGKLAGSFRSCMLSKMDGKRARVWS
jgi:hypothetical protein